MENAMTGDEWFCRVSLDPTFDLAAAQRAEAGDAVQHVFARAPIPKDIEVPWDEIFEQIYSLGEIYS
jgi:hypothetical protein